MLAGDDQLGSAAGVAEHHGLAKRHGFQGGEREGLRVGHQRHHVAAGGMGPHILLKSGDAHVRAQAEHVRGLLDPRPQRPIADEERLRGHPVPAQARDRAQEVDGGLLRAQG